MWKMLKKIEVYSLKQVGELVLDGKSGGAVLKHATDSTTRKVVVGTFAPAEIHIEMNTYHYQHCPLHQRLGTTQLTP